LDPAPLERGHYVYVLACADGTLYTGYAVDVGKRLAAHRAGKGARYVRGRLPVELRAWWAFETKGLAMSAEASFKRLDRAAKLRLLGASGAEAGTTPAFLVKRNVTKRSRGGSWV
jgi:putative endonuclease